MIESQENFKAYGVAAGEMSDLVDAQCNTFTAGASGHHDHWPPTPLTFKENPTNWDIINARNVLDIGCGPGRNLPWIMENTKANYYGLDPNPDMLKFFQIPNEEWADRVHTSLDFDEKFDNSVFDVVLCTFVFQHVGFRPVTMMDVGEITKRVLKSTSSGTVWFLFEHQSEEPGWFDKWENMFGGELKRVYFSEGFPEEHNYMNSMNYVTRHGLGHQLRIYVQY